MNPVLSLMADNKTRSVKEVLAELSLQQSWSDEELEEMLPSGSQTVAHSRIGWAITYLKKAGLLSCPHHSLVFITAEGKGVVTKLVEDTNENFLSRHPELTAHYNSLDKKLSQTDCDVDTDCPDVSPDYTVDSADISRQLLLADVLLEFHNTDTKIPTRVENILIDLLRRTGYSEDVQLPVSNVSDEKVMELFSNEQRETYTVTHSTKRWRVIKGFARALNRPPINRRKSYGDCSDTVQNVVCQLTTRVISIDLLALARVMIDYRVDLETLWIK